MIQKVFNRYEKKYLLDQKTYEVFKKELDVYMAEDSTYFLEIKKNITAWSIKDGSPYLGKKPKSIWKKEMRQKKPVRSIGKWITFLPIMGSDQSAISLITGWQCLERTTRISALPLMWRSAAAPII